MATYRDLKKKARELGYELTPQLKAELRTLASVSDDDLRAAYRAHVVEELARDFKVPKAVMESRLGDWKG